MASTKLPSLGYALDEAGVLSSSLAALYQGQGNPNNRVTAVPGSLFVDLINGRLYLKQDGADNFGWTLVSGGGSGTVNTIGQGAGITVDSSDPANPVVSLSTGAQAALALAATAVQPDRAINAGAGLTGGGSLAADRTISLSGASIASLGLADTAVQPSRTISAGTGLTGGGSLAADRTISLSGASIASLALADTAVQPARAITAGTGLTGGGDLSADRSFALSGASIASLALADTAVQPTRTLVAGNGLTGGGNLAGDRTFNVGAGTGITVNADDVSLSAATITSLGLADTAIQPNRTLTAGAGLTGGGTLAADRTFDVGAGTGITVAADSVAVDQSFAPTWTGLHTWSSTEPRHLFNESDQGTNLKLWDFDVASAVFAWRTRTDADGTGVNIIAATRGATTSLADLSLGNAADNNTFKFLGTGQITLGGGLLVGADAATATSAGRAIQIQAGPGGSTSGTGGALSLLGGVPANGIGGGVSITAAAGVGTNRGGGSITITSGTATGNALGGNFNMTAGIGGPTGNGGSFNCAGGSGGATAGNGGSFNAAGGAGVGSGNGGTLNLNSGSADAASGTGTGSGGDVNISSGNGGDVSGNGGIITIQSGSPTTSGSGGDIVLSTGFGDGSNPDGFIHFKIATNSAMQINGVSTTGTRTATFVATNKPGSGTSGPISWLPVLTSGGTQGYIPIFGA